MCAVSQLTEPFLCCSTKYQRKGERKKLLENDKFILTRHFFQTWSLGKLHQKGNPCQTAPQKSYFNAISDTLPPVGPHINFVAHEGTVGSSPLPSQCWSDHSFVLHDGSLMGSRTKDFLCILIVIPHMLQLFSASFPEVNSFLLPVPSVCSLNPHSLVFVYRHQTMSGRMDAKLHEWHCVEVCFS